MYYSLTSKPSTLHPPTFCNSVIFLKKNYKKEIKIFLYKSRVTKGWRVKGVWLINSQSDLFLIRRIIVFF